MLSLLRTLAIIHDGSLFGMDQMSYGTGACVCDVAEGDGCPFGAPSRWSFSHM